VFPFIATLFLKTSSFTPHYDVKHHTSQSHVVISYTISSLITLVTPAQTLNSKGIFSFEWTSTLYV